MPETLSREFALAAACCQWPPSDRRNRAIGAAAASGIDWDAFLRVIQRHRIAGLVHDSLMRAGIAVPAAPIAALETAAHGIARQNLLYMAETLRLQKTFDDAGLAVLFVKGAALARLIYGGSLALRHSWDIDLLVSPGAVPEAIGLLKRAGFYSFPPLPPMNDHRYRLWIEFHREQTFFHETNAVYAELHWKLASNTRLLPTATAATSTQMVMLSPEIGIRTLGDDELFTYLCVHGAWHAWARLKWLADIAALVSAMDQREIERRLRVARDAGADRCVAQALLLCDRLFGVPQLAPIAAKLRRSSRNRWLENVAFKALSPVSGDAELHDIPFGTTLMMFSHFAMGRGWGYVAREIWNKSISWEDRVTLPLPRPLSFLYPILRGPLWIVRRFKNRGRLTYASPPSTREQKAEIISRS